MNLSTRTIVGISAGAVAVTAVVALLATGTLTSMATVEPVASSSAPSSPPPSSSATPSASAKDRASVFLDSWVDDGRVVRRDQGSDTVSEGQAYGLLLALAADDKTEFASIWDWTKDNLQRSDGLLAWRWDDGKVVDDQPASDADLDAARALVLAGKQFDETSYTTAGVKLAGAIADKLTVETAAGRILLPGLWAAGAEPYTYNPSYASPVSFAVLSTATGDPRWKELEAGSAAVTHTLLSATALPPDWAQVHQDGTVDPLTGPGGQGNAVSYGYDADRLVLRAAESCSATDRAYAAKVFGTLDQHAELPAVLDLGGGSLSGDESPLAYTARAASAAADGQSKAATADLTRAAKLSASTPTYYGAAWVALATVMLQKSTLGGCPILSGGSA